MNRYYSVDAAFAGQYIVWIVIEAYEDEDEDSGQDPGRYT
jgi:hypothetical protein